MTLSLLLLTVVVSHGYCGKLTIHVSSLEVKSPKFKNPVACPFQFPQTACVAQILIDINNKNTEKDIGVTAKDHKSKSASHQRALISINAQTKG